MLLTALVIVGLTIIGILAGYALFLTREVKEKQRQQENALQKLSNEAAEQRLRINRSIQIIAQGLLDDQLSLTEGAIRIRGLLDILSIDGGLREEFKAFDLLADSTGHIPILDQWKALKAKQKAAFDRERQKLEVDHKEFVEDAARRIQGRSF